MKLAIAGACCLITPLHAAAQSTPPAQRQFGYRVQVEGPQQAAAGTEVTYRISYTLVDPSWRSGLGMEVSWPSADASLVSATALSGPPGTVTRLPVLAGQMREFFRWDLRQDGTGVLAVVLRIGNGVAGDLLFGVDFAGTDIQLPANSITSVTTHVAPALPSTGHQALASHSGEVRRVTIVAAAWLGLLGALLASCGFTRRRRP